MKSPTVRTIFVTFGLVMLAMPALAAERRPYDPSAFANARAAGFPVLVDISAPWCVACAVQNAAIVRNLLRPEFTRFQIFDVDFDHQKDVVRQFNATNPSTLIIFKGSRETARVIGGTDTDLIGAMMQRAIP